MPGYEDRRDSIERLYLHRKPLFLTTMAAVELLQEAADCRGISMKLNKKPKKE